MTIARVQRVHADKLRAREFRTQAAGLRVTPGDRSHLLRLETALDQAEDDTEDLLERLDASRERRNEASYAAGFVAQASLADARDATAELLEIAREFVG